MSFNDLCYDCNSISNILSFLICEDRHHMSLGNKLFWQVYGESVQKSTMISDKQMRYICLNNIPIKKWMIKNCTNINVNIKWKHRPIHYICKTCDHDLIDCVLDRDDLMLRDLPNKYPNGIQPIHLICRYGSLENLKKIVSKNVNLEATTCQNLRPVHYLGKYGDLNKIKYFLGLGGHINDLLRYYDGKNHHMVHYVFRYNTYDVMEYIVGKYGWIMTDPIRCKEFKIFEKMSSNSTCFGHIKKYVGLKQLATS
jgi:hypothetical protein